MSDRVSNEEILEFLENREWIYDDNPPQNSCWECGASVRSGEYEKRQHNPGCRLKLAIDQLRAEVEPDLCGFDEAWVGRCKEPRGCPKHTGLLCGGCEKPATRSCDHTGQFVCGAPLCEGCAHSPPDSTSPNLFGMGGGHESREIATLKWKALLESTCKAP